MRLPSASYSRLSQTRSIATLRRSSGTEASGTIFAAFTIAESSPASTASCRNTELSTERAAGLRPNDTLETPRVVWMPGYFALIWRIASMVSIASRRVSSWPVAIGKVSASTMMSSTFMPQSFTSESTSRDAMRTLCSAVRAWPSSSIVRAMTAAPCSLTSGMMRPKRDSGAVAVLEVHRVDHRTAADELHAGLQHGGLGRVDDERQVDALASRETTSRMSATPSRPT